MSNAEKAYLDKEHQPEDEVNTFDHHFREISNLISVFAPAEYLAALEGASQS